MRFLVSASSVAIVLYLSQRSHAQEQEPFRNDTISWGTSPLIFSKRTTCSGTCAECYGSGSILCGTNDACFNPTIGDSCCAQYSYSCPDGYYCAPDGLDMQCCANSVSTSECTNSINSGGGTSGGGSSSGHSGLSTGAKAGIGIGVALLFLIIAGVATWFFFRQRNRRRNIAPAPVAWQMPELAGGPGGPGVAQGGYNGAQGGYDNHQGGYNGGYGNPDVKGQHFGGGGPPVAEVYMPGDGPQKAGYNGYVSSHAELQESPPVHIASPAMPHNYPVTTEQDRARAAEMYGGYPGQNY